MSEGAEMVEAYDQSLPHKIAGAAWAAIRDMRPVRIGAGRGHSAYRGEPAIPAAGGRGGHRRAELGGAGRSRGPGGPGGQGGRAAAGGAGELRLPPDHGRAGLRRDHAGLSRGDEAGRGTATGSTAFFLQGACGDIGPVRGVARNGQHEYRRLGSMLGHEASRVWWELEVPGRAERYVGTLESGSPLAIYADEPLPEAARHLRVISRTVDLPTKQVGDLATFEAESAAHIARLNGLRAGGGDREEIRRADDAGQAGDDAGRAGTRPGGHERAGGRDPGICARLGHCLACDLGGTVRGARIADQG